MGQTTVYTSKPLVKGYISRSYSATDLPDSSDTTYESIDTKILRVSRSIDSIVGSVFCTFNSISGTPTTPYVIVDIATTWVVGLCNQQLVPGGRNDAMSQRAQEDIANSMQRCQAIMGDSQTDSESRVIPPEVVTTETLTFGAGGQYDLSTTEAFINVHSLLTSADRPLIIAESVKPLLTGYTAYHYGRDFDVYFSNEHQKWVFRDYSGSFASATGTKAITYWWDWRRATWAPKQATATSTGLIGGF